MSSIVAIVGRPNVGKSTLFNRLIQRRQAIVDSFSGVTRDRHYGKSDWNGKQFSIIDTGGYVVGSDDVFEEEIRKQVNLAIDESDVIVFVVDVETGITSIDIDLAKMLRRVRQQVFLVINKVDNAMRITNAVEFYGLGLGDYYSVSSVNGSGTGELLDAITKVMPEEKNEEQVGILPKFAVVGRPNAGKSSIVNVLLGHNRNIVTDLAGTTRDTLDVVYDQYGFKFILVDTAGIRKKSKVKEDLEFYSVMRAVRAIEHCDVSILVVDATRGFQGQDEAIFWLSQRNKKGVVVLVNKWDLIEKDTHTKDIFEKKIRNTLSPFSQVPIIFTSAITKKRIFKIVETVMEVYKNRSMRISTNKLNNVMLDIIKNNPPPSVKGKHIKIKFCTQLPTPTPQFAFFANLPQYIKDSYKRFVENKMRENFDFYGVPIDIYFRKK